MAGQPDCSYKHILMSVSEKQTEIQMEYQTNWHMNKMGLKNAMLVSDGIQLFHI